MSNVEILDAPRDASGGYKVDVGRGQRIGRVSSEWFSRPDDERFLSLTELYDFVHGRSERSRSRTVESAAVRVEASRDDGERLCADRCPARPSRSRRRIGASASSRAWSARRPPTFASFPPPWRGSTCNMA